MEGGRQQRNNNGNNNVNSLAGARRRESSIGLHEVYPSFKPAEVTLTGIAAYLDADPEPVLVIDAPFAYIVKVLSPCPIPTLSGIRGMATEDGMGMRVLGSVDVNEFIDEDYPLVRSAGGRRRLYCAARFTISFPLPHRIHEPSLRGRGTSSCPLDRDTLKFIVPKCFHGGQPPPFSPPPALLPLPDDHDHDHDDPSSSPTN